jgi:tRNA uridine 5-carboxymethylaminomethyl modification enzyme
VYRLKTGTPARVKSSSLDYDEMERQDGEAARPFSFMNGSVDRPSLPCWITYTTAETHAIIRSGLGRSPLYGGAIKGRGPRYCPSIEDKVVRFPDRDRHQVFIEPEGVYTDEMYLGGLSTSLPQDVQEAFIHSVPGLRRATIVRPAYAVEYDCLDPRMLRSSLESRMIKGLYVAGQANGSSGYEEAAAQGIVAGINAARSLAGEEAIVIGRSEAYIGVLIDDLVTRGAEEPYRMFTSRAERRLSLRHDSADLRLTPRAAEIGLASAERLDRFERRRAGVAEIAELLRARRVSPSDVVVIPALQSHVGASIADALRDPAFRGDLPRIMPELSERFPPEWIETAELDARYAGYVEKETRLAGRMTRAERMKIPDDFDFRAVVGLSKEAVAKLEAVRPETVGQAARVSGVRAADAALLLAALAKKVKLRADHELSPDEPLTGV